MQYMMTVFKSAISPFVKKKGFRPDFGSSITYVWWRLFVKFSVHGIYTLAYAECVYTYCLCGFR